MGRVSDDQMLRITLAVTLNSSLLATEDVTPLGMEKDCSLNLDSSKRPGQPKVVTDCLRFSVYFDKVVTYLLLTLRFLRVHISTTFLS